MLDNQISNAMDVQEGGLAALCWIKRHNFPLQSAQDLHRGPNKLQGALLTQWLDELGYLLFASLEDLIDRLATTFEGDGNNEEGIVAANVQRSGCLERGIIRAVMDEEAHFPLQSAQDLQRGPRTL